MSADERSSRVADVLRLGLVEGVGVRAIARKLGMARKTVRRILGRHRAPPKPAEKRGSLLDAYEPAIRKILDDAPDMLAPAVLERLRPLGYTGGVTILRARLRAMRPQAKPQAFLTLSFEPGEAMQIDWADFGFALPGMPRRVSAFAAVLCHSRRLYLEFTLSQAMGSFLRCMERCLAFYGGATAVDIFDNMKTVVLSHTAAATVFNPRFSAYARSRGFAVRACNVRKAHEKGRIERPIGFVRRRFWLGRRFPDLLDLNAQAFAWRDDFANGRVHEDTGKVPQLVFEHQEKPRLKPLPTTPFNTDDVEGTGVTKMFRVPFDRNKYSVPWRLASQQVIVRADDRVVRVFLADKQVAEHPRCWSVGQDIEHPDHRQALLDEKPRALAAGSLPPALTSLGDTGKGYFKLLAAGSRSIHRDATRLVLLVELFGAGDTASAMTEVMQTGHVGADYVEYVLRHKRGLDPQPPPLRLGDHTLDAISVPEPDLSVYDQLPAARMTRDPGEPPTGQETP
ncbi:MAG: IS21 family transposase [Solirubrobacterales bacterium]|nr:IS21 family transposase [Solirubrobacterales bacterium]